MSLECMSSGLDRGHEACWFFRVGSGDSGSVTVRVEGRVEQDHRTSVEACVMRQLHPDGLEIFSSSLRIPLSERKRDF